MKLRADSCSKCNGGMMKQGCIGFQRRGEVQTFARARVQAMGDGVQLALHVPPQVGALGQLLVQQPKGAECASVPTSRGTRSSVSLFASDERG